MGRLEVGAVAPEFALPNAAGTTVSLTELRRAQQVLLVFNLGFV